MFPKVCREPPKFYKGETSTLNYQGIICAQINSSRTYTSHKHNNDTILFMKTIKHATYKTLF